MFAFCELFLYKRRSVGLVIHLYRMVL